MECCRRIGRSLRSIFYIIGVAAYHACRCDEGKVAVAVGFEAECHHIGAASAAGIRQGVVFPRLEVIAAGIECIALCRVGDGASAAAATRPAATTL